MASPRIYQVANLQTELTTTADSANNRVLRAGDTMTGELNVANNLVVTGGLSVSNNAVLSGELILSSNPSKIYFGNTLSGSFVQGTNTGGYLILATNNQEVARFSGNNFGIGTTSPATTLGVVGSAVFSGFEPFISFSPNQEGSTPAYWQYYSNSGISVFYNQGPNSNGVFAFYTGAGAETVRFDPSALSVKGISAGSGIIDIYSNAQTTNKVTLGQGFANGTDNIAFLYNRANAAFVFGTNNTERARITNLGNIGVGTSNPAHKIHTFTPDGSGDSAIRISTGFSTGTSFDLTVGGNGNYSPGVFAIRNIQTNSTPLYIDGQVVQLGNTLNLNANHIRLGYPDTDGTAQGGGRGYYMLAANNFYQSTNAIGLQTNVTHNIGSMVAFKVAGYVYGSPGPFEYMVGFYSGENGIYNSYYSCMPTDFFGEVRVYKRDSDDKLMILFGNTGVQTAVAGIVAERYIHGFYGQNDDFANGWVLRGFTNTTGYTLLNNTTRVDH